MSLRINFGDASGHEPARWFVPSGSASIVRLSAATIALVGGSGVAHAQFTPPDGVTDYRLMFVTQQYLLPTSTDIAYYNNFVTEQAALNPSLPATTWTAMASTLAVSAVANISCGDACDATVPIYLVDGTTLIATSAESLFQTGALASAAEDQFGNPADFYVWTGSDSAGYNSVGQYGEDFSMGGTYLGNNFTELGYAGTLNRAFNLSEIMDIGYSAEVGVGPQPIYAPIYAISGLIGPALADSTDIPEPNSAAALLAGGLVLTRVFRRRRTQA